MGRMIQAEERSRTDERQTVTITGTSMLTEGHIVEALRACYATIPPYRQPLNIVDLGLTEDIALAHDPEAPGAGIPGVPQRQRLTLTLLAAAPGEDAEAQLQAQIANRLAGLEALSRVTIHFAATPLWSPSRISPAGRRALSLDFPILNHR